MFKYLSVVFLLALAAAVAAEEEVHDQAAAEQYFSTYGFYPSWYNPSVYSAVNGRRSFGYAYSQPAYAAAAYPYAFNGLRSLTYPAYPANNFNNFYGAGYAAYPSSFGYTAPTTFAYRNY